ATIVVAGADADSSLARALGAATGARVVPLADAARLVPPHGADAIAACAVAAGLVAGAGRAARVGLVLGGTEPAGHGSLRRAVARDGIRLHGRAESFDAVDALRRGLAASPLLADVTAEETRTTVDGRRVEFRLRAARKPALGASS